MKRNEVGGQAVIEGVMMKSDRKIAISVRKRKKIVTKKQTLKPNSKFAKLPFIRGVVNLYQMLFIGIKALMWSAEQDSDEGEEEIKPWELTLLVIASFLVVFLFFIGLPYILTNLIGFNEEARPILFNLVDGFMRILFFLGYVIGVSFMKDVRRLFQYHGAEHKVINCFESGKKLNVKNIKRFSTLHPRCGTSFMIMVLLIAIAIFSVIPSIVMYFFSGFIDLGLVARKAILFSIRIIVVPIIAGISYEGLKLSDKFKGGHIMKVLIKPGLLMQKYITTKEPTEKQIEVALTSLKKVL
ncbi:DUF1385 domain-containing protein [Candidatus Woesearchaeota archaeon]|nr:DUF1385 domain-containing protein [Candidatus Woesearchaeota archaeon]